MEFGAALLQVWRDVGVKQLYLHDSSHLPHKKSLLNVWHFQNGGSGEGRLHFKLIQERFFFFLIRCIVHLSQNSFLPRTQTGRGETVVQSNEGWYKKIIIWFKWEQKYIRRKLKSMINLTIKACFISKHMSFFFCTLPYKMSINTYCFFVVFFIFQPFTFWNTDLSHCVRSFVHTEDFNRAFTGPEHGPIPEKSHEQDPDITSFHLTNVRI